MPEEAPTTGASEENQPGEESPKPGVSNDGRTGETRPAADSAAFAAEKEAMQATIRKLQSERDSAVSRAERIQKAASEIDAPTDTRKGEAPAGLTMADLLRVREVDRLVPTLKEKFPDADPALMDADPLRYESAEAYRLAVAQSHEDRKALREQMEKEADAKVKARYVAAGYSPLADDAPPANATPPAGLPTAAQIAKMGLQEQIAFDEANPGVIDKILEAASGDALIGSKIGH